MPKVSVIIPVYNASQYLAECLESIISGRLKEIEVIAVDDGSTDNSLDILNEYKVKYGIKVLTQQNSGPAKARNAGLNVATGEFVGFVDSDDWVEPDMFEKMYQAAKSEDADIVFCNIYRNENSKLKKYIPTGVYDSNGIRQTILPLLISNLDENKGKSTLRGSTWSKIFRRILLENNNIRYSEQLVYNEDVLFCIEATLCANKYVYLGDSFLYHNRYVPGSLTKRFIPNLWPRQKAMTTKLKELVRDVDYDFLGQIDKKMMEIAIYCVENISKKDNPASPKQQRAEIQQIISSPELQSAIKNVKFNLLKNINKLYWLCFWLKSPRLSMMTAHYRVKN
ncbi:MAG: glycosyltransferase [Muribaculum sp.]|nr:glycosyltransferase [Muribaculum sp.]